MAAGEQGLTPRQVMPETWQRETIVFVQFIAVSSTDMQQRSIAY